MNHTGFNFTQGRKLHAVHNHRQSTGYTCGPSCVVMLLRLYGKIDYRLGRRALVKKELAIYDEYHSQALGMGMSGAALAQCLSSYGFRVELLHSHSNYMDNEEGYFDRETFLKFLEEYSRQLDGCGDLVCVRTNAAIHCDILRSHLAQGKELLLECIVPGTVNGVETELLHWILVYGFEGNTFRVCDPDYGKCTLTEAELEKYMNTPIGRICLIVSV